MSLTSTNKQKKRGRPKKNEKILETNIDLLLNSTNIKYDISKEPDLKIEMNKVLKYLPSTTDGKIIDDPQFTFFAIPYGPNVGDYDILSSHELQVMVNAQILENNLKIMRQKRTTPDGIKELESSDDVFTLSKLQAWKSLSSRTTLT